MSLIAAAAALDALAAGQKPKRGDVIAGALVLQTLMNRGELDRDLQDAALGLERAGRDRAGDLATKVRELASHH